MVHESREAHCQNDLKRKLTGDDRFDVDQLADEGVPVDPRRARIEYPSDTDDDDNDEDLYSSESSDDSLSDTSASECESEDTIHETTTSTSVSPVPSVDISSSPHSTDSDPDHAQTVHRNRRKSYLPVKSPNPEDPKFKGVTVQFRTLVHHDQVQLTLTAYFNCRKMARRLSSWKHGFYSTPSPHDESTHSEKSSYNMRRGRQSNVYHQSDKQCASCCTRKTPLWRGAEDGTPLCNACGIRYKKYRVRCGHCWFVPKKDSKTNPVCSNCGERLRFSVFRFRHGIM